MSEYRSGCPPLPLMMMMGRGLPLLLITRVAMPYLYRYLIRATLSCGSRFDLTPGPRSWRHGKQVELLRAVGQARWNSLLIG